VNTFQAFLRTPVAYIWPPQVLQGAGPTDYGSLKLEHSDLLSLNLEWTSFF